MGSPDSFELVKEQYIEEYDSQVLLYKHKKTGELPLLQTQTFERPCFMSASS